MNTHLVITTAIALFFTYGVKLFWYSIGIDTENLIVYSRHIGWETIGRFGLVLLQKLWYIREFSPYTAFFVTFCFIWLFTISWCYILAVFGKNTGRNNALIPFALLFMTSPIWAEQFYFVLQSAETAFIVFVCPYAIYLLYKGFLDNEHKKTVCGFILFILMTSVYQGIVPIFCCGVFACFLILQENSCYEPKTYRLLCLKLFLSFLAAMAVYVLLDKFMVSIVFKTVKSTYLDNMNLWGKEPVKNIALRILCFGYNITIGHIPTLQAIFEPLIGHFSPTGIAAAKAVSAYSPIAAGNVLLLPAVILFLIQTVETARKTIPIGRRLLYILAGIGVPLSIMALSIIGGNAPALRSMFVLPFAMAFMCLVLMNRYKKFIATIFGCIVLITAIYQAQITAQLFYSDYMRYQDDIRLALELDGRITQAQDDTDKLPVAIIGKYRTASRFKTNFLQGEVIGHSFFEWDGNSTPRGLAFMRTLGIQYERPNAALMKLAEEESASMPSYPASGYVKRLPEVVVVKLSDDPSW